MYQIRNKELEVISLYRGDYTARFYLRQISKLSSIPLKTCQNTLLELEKSKVLKGRVEGKNKYFGLNLDNIRTKSYLLQSEIYKTDLFFEHYPLFKTFLKSVSTNTLIVVFGSFAKLKADKGSDLDLLIVSDKKESLPFHLLPYTAHKMELTESQFAKALKEQETLMKEIEENHIILNNHSLFANLMWGTYGKK